MFFTLTLYRPNPHDSLTPTQAARAMSLLSEAERADVLRYYHVKDAKLSLGSALLKRLVIAQHCGGAGNGVSWTSATPVRDERTKPVFYCPPGSGQQPLLFNVSHQAGLVVLFAVEGAAPGTQIGVDVVCPRERRTRDLSTIKGEGWPHYVDVHSSVFSHGEAERLKKLPFSADTASAVGGGAGAGAGEASAPADELLAYFYSLWCLREAYVKMTGEALLASWLQDLDMRNFAPPGEVSPSDDKAASGDLRISFGVHPVTDVDMRLEWFLGREYMISTAVRRPGKNVPPEFEVGEFELLEIGAVLATAETLLARA